MENLEYFRILVTGYFKHSSFLKDHIYREFKKAEKDFINKDEFFERCNNIIKWLKNEFDKRVNEQKKDYYDILHSLKHEPETVNCGEIPIDQHIIEIENRLKTISRNDFPVNLRHIRGVPADYFMDFQNILEYSDLQYIETAIKQALGMAVLDDIAKDIKEPEQPKGKDYSGMNKNITVKQIALVYVYNNDLITRDNANNIVKKYGYTSGEGLYQDFIKYSNVQNRSGRPSPLTRKKLNNQIERIKSIIQHLSDKGKQQANKDLEKLNELYQNEFD